MVLSPLSITAIAELVVPKSIPYFILLMIA
jgi:hypothetical protein